MDIEKGADIEKAERSRDFDRFITFVDAIVAIAITLLILPLVDLAGQVKDGDPVAGVLRAHSAEIWGFLLSFSVIASLWFSQHRVVRTVVALDPVVTRLMLAWTLTIVVLPFPTALVAQTGSQPTTKVFYIGTMALSSLLLALLSIAIRRDRSIRDDSGDQPDPAPGLGAFIAFLLALAISLAVPATSYWPLLLLLLPDRVIAAWRRRRAARTASARVGV